MQRNSSDEERESLLTPSINGRMESNRGASDSDIISKCCGIRLVYTKRNRNRLLSIISIVSILICALVVILALYANNVFQNNPPPKKSVILMISDGFGPSSETFARNYHSTMNKLPAETMLPLDTILVGQSRTRSTSSLITDSAAGATAFSCGMKSYNGAISVDDNKDPCGTVLEAAKQKGMKTGLVATSRITHATPACFSAHVPHRDMEDIIAQHQLGNYTLGRSVDLMFGGGRCFFLPQEDKDSCRTDSRDLIKEGQMNGWDIASDIDLFTSITAENANLPLLRLLAVDHMSYEIDRDSTKEPSLKEMAQKAIEVLHGATKDSDEGFFLMIEGSRIDMAAHDNDPAAHLRDILAYQDTIDYVKSFVADTPGVVMVSVSDHETGGLSVGRQVTPEYPEYLWKPEILEPVTSSAHILSQSLEDFKKLNKTTRDMEEFVEIDLIIKGLGLTDFLRSDIEYLTSANTTYSDVKDYFAEMVSVRAEISWSTHGHSGADVNLYAYGPNADDLNGSHENNEIGQFIADYLDLDLQSITQQLAVGPRVEESVSTLKSLNFEPSHFHHHN